jgi:photosystem II stability/assembly factor-like uncharacterized protein
MAKAMASSKRSLAFRGGRGTWIVAALILFLTSSLYAWTQDPQPIGIARSTMSMLLYPVESNAADRLPTIQNRVTDVALSADGQHAVAVGSYGGILISGKGGQSWIVRTSGITHGLYGVSLSADGQRAVAVGDHGVILTSNDGGQSWAAQLSGTSNGFGDVALSADGWRAIAVGGGGVILVSSDGGKSWASQASGTTKLLTHVSLSADGQHAIAISDEGVILVSRSGGQSWSVLPSPSKSSLADVSLSANGQRAVAVDTDGMFLTSSDGGQSWSLPATETVKDMLVGVSLSSDGQTGLAVTRNGIVFSSINGGQSWAVEPRVTNEYLRGVTLSRNGQRAVAFGGGMILTSSNKGQSWARQTSVSANSLTDVDLSADAQHAVAVGDEGVILTSRTSGQSWTAHGSGSTNLLKGVSLSGDGEIMIAVGFGGIVLSNANGMDSWTTQATGTRDSLYSISLSANRQSAVAVGHAGIILTSNNGGRSWVYRKSGTTNLLRDVSLTADGRRAIVVGDNGVILSSSDGGQSWTERESGFAGVLKGVSLSGDGMRIVAVGNDTILTSNNAGQTWVADNRESDVELTDVSLSENGERAVVVGNNGAILASGDGGQSWTAQASGIAQDLCGISLSADGLRAVAVGEYGAILTSSNGGQNWHNGTIVKSNTRYPAPWYYAALILCTAFLHRAFSGLPREPRTGAAAMAASDAPAMSLDQDRLDFAPLARGISRFLRNANTDPPLTLAITGEWGTGKSSLMGQVCDDLKANHWRPVWFNAWHHQNEEQLLAALLVAVRESGVPPIASFGGLAFRLRLMLIRARQQLFATFMIVVLASLILAFVYQHPDVAEWKGMVALSNAFKSYLDGKSDLSALRSALPILGTIGVLVAIGRTIKAFGVDPAVLLSSTMSKFRLKDASAQTSFRMRFAEQFGEVTQALAHPMVIVIDDLDRCQPKTVLDVMEAVNFLTSSGKCFVIFGMATQRVQAALALSFKEIAGELAQFDVAGDERTRRQQYARDYLEKLINIEVLVPDRTDLPPSKMFDARKDEVKDRLADILAEIRRWWLIAPLITAVALGVWLATLVQLPEAKEAPAPSAPVDQPQDPKRTTTPDPEKPVVVTKPVELSNQPPAIIPGDDGGISLIWFLLAFAALGMAGAGLFVRWLQRQILTVQDTKAFTDAFRIWLPIATFTRKSPRSKKRFANRIRYLAMLQQGEQLDDKTTLTKTYELVREWVSKVSARFKTLAKPDSETPPPSDVKKLELALTEHRVVALGALHNQFGDKWRNYAINPQAELYADTLSNNPTGLGSLLIGAVDSYRQIEGTNWPPSEPELDAFERSLKGVRLPGDGRTFDPNVPTQQTPPNPKPEAKEEPKSKRAPPPSRKGAGQKERDAEPSA